MEPAPTLILVAVLALYTTYLLGEFLLGRRPRYVAPQLLALALAATLFHLSTGFPIPVQSFGSHVPLTLIVIIGFCIVSGILSSVFFFSEEFRAAAVIKPLLASPIIMIPILGLVEQVNDFDTMSIVMLCLISYQNGFFWKTLFKKLDIAAGEPT